MGTNEGLCSFDGKNFKTLNKKDGLVGNVIRTLLIDSKENIWIGTDQGISVYNGFSFESIQKENGLAGTTILCFLEDHSGNIWAGTDDDGLNKISKSADGKFKVETFNGKNGLTNNSVFDLIQNKDNSIWAATLGDGINVISQKKENGDFEIRKSALVIPSEMILSFAKDKKGNIWLGTYDAGAFKVNASDVTKENAAPIVSFNIANGLSANAIWKLIVSDNGDVWMGTIENGVNRLRLRNDGSTDHISLYTKDEGLPGNMIYSFLEDREGNVWIGTNGSGLCMSTGDFFSHYFEKENVHSSQVQGIVQDEEKNLWVASSANGVSKMSFNPLQTQHFNEQTGFITNNTSCIASGKLMNKNIWIGTASKGVVKYDGKKFTNYKEADGLISDRVYSIYVDKKGIVWIGTAAGISRFDGVRFLNLSMEKLKMESDGIFSIIEDNKNNIWFATAGGIARYGGDGSIRTFDEKEGLTTKAVNSIAEAENGDIWIGTFSGGLYKLDISKNDTNAISFGAGEPLLISNSIRSLIFENKNTLIVGTYKGFDKIKLDATNKILGVKHYTATDGFLGLECNDNSIYKDDKRDIWFGTVKGLTKYSPALEKTNHIAPALQITNIQLFYKDVDWRENGDSILPWFRMPASLNMTHDENQLTFKFSAISMRNPDKVTYKYMLEGTDKEWSPARSESEITYSGIEPGHYTFKVQAANEYGIWTAPVEFNFSIQPPWYKTAAFYIFSILAGGLLIFSYFKFREKKLIREKQALEVVVKERTHEVMEQKEHLAEKNKEITDSINYAKGIQHAMLPPLNEIKNAWQDLFVFFQPKDIVSGDFYWFQAINEHEFLIACADCTGHGVPGGFMSMVCSGKLHDAAKESSEPAIILSKTNDAVKEFLRQQTEGEGKNKDGMEICLLRINTLTQQISYAGANRLLWIIDFETKELTEIKPTKASIASFTEFGFEYQQHNFTLKKNDLIYTTSDGYPDQFGGADGKKYMSKKLKTLIVDSCNLPMEEQHMLFQKDINTWMANYEQVDDLLLIGIRL